MVAPTYSFAYTNHYIIVIIICCCCCWCLYSHRNIFQKRRRRHRWRPPLNGEMCVRAPDWWCVCVYVLNSLNGNRSQRRQFSWCVCVSVHDVCRRLNIFIKYSITHNRPSMHAYNNTKWMKEIRFIYLLFINRIHSICNCVYRLRCEHNNSSNNKRWSGQSDTTYTLPITRYGVCGQCEKRRRRRRK